MKYAVWFLRLLFAAWMIPAGVNHFIPLFPQPMGTQPLSQELIVALLDSHLFDMVKAVELIAGIGVLTGMYLPLALVVCMPVSFCVFYWDTPLEGWGSRASIFGEAVLLCNVLLCLACIKSYRSMFAVRTTPRTFGAADAPPATLTMKRLVRVGCLVFGAWMLANGINHFFFPFYPEPTGNEPLAVQLMDALVHSRLFDVAMAIQLVTGALILIGIFVPLALCVVMPISTCAVYWSVVLEHQPLGAVLALAAFALNGLLMLAYLDYYKGVLQRRTVTAGEAWAGGMNFESLFVNPNGRTSRGQYVGALIVLLAVAAFYAFLVGGLTAEWCLVVLLFPATVLHARRLRDMGRTAWLLLAPVALIVAGTWLHMGKLKPQFEDPVALIALAVSAVFVLWCVAGKEQAQANRFGQPATA